MLKSEVQRRLLTADRSAQLAVAAGGLGLLAIGLLVTPVPATIRLIVFIALIPLGPAAVALRLVRWEVPQSVTIGAATNIAILMIGGQLLVMTRWWHPTVMVCSYCAATILLSIALLKERPVR